jgi:ribosomal protein L40E
MGSLTLAMLIVCVIGLICIGISTKSSAEPASSESASSWECETCGAANPSNWQACRDCGMERSA